MWLFGHSWKIKTWNEVACVGEGCICLKIDYLSTKWILSYQVNLHFNLITIIKEMYA